MVIKRLFSRVRKTRKTAKNRPKAKAKKTVRKAKRVTKRKVKARAVRRTVKRKLTRKRKAVRAKRTVKARRAVRRVKAKKPASRVVKKTARKKVVKVKKPVRATAALSAKEVGRVTHYFDGISVAVVDLSSTLRQGDQIHIKGHTTNIRQRAASMQINHVPVSVARAGESIGLKVADRVRDGDRVFKLG